MFMLNIKTTPQPAVVAEIHCTPYIVVHLGVPVHWEDIETKSHFAYNTVYAVVMLPN